MFYNRKKVKQYIQEKAGVSISSGFWSALDLRIMKVLDIALREVGSHRRLTEVELLGYRLLPKKGNKKIGVDNEHS